MRKRSLGRLLVLGLFLAGVAWASTEAAAARPNVVLVMTDDQGYGDLGCHGNDVIKTPTLDKLYAQSVRLTNFHVDPTCSPTRSALLTGHYSVRTGVWHTIQGRSMLRRDELTFGNLLGEAGYRTAAFGKWHLGDNYPFRPHDRGFDETLVHGGGGIVQTPDYFGNTYFSPTLMRNGKWEPSDGYCTNVFFDAALAFIEKNKEKPFFIYLPTNVAHGPYQVADEYSKPYRDAGLPANLANFYGMITNFDENMARLMATLDRLGLAENTVLIYMTDNGTSGRGFNSGMNGRKGSIYDGGHRVPCFIRWPAELEAGRDIDHLTAHVDIVPTLLEICDAEKPEGLEFDGQSILPLLTGKGQDNWPDRALVVESHRIEHPEKWRKSAVMTDRFRLVNGKELFDMRADPGQKKNVADANPKVVKQLRKVYESYWADVSKRFDEYCEIVLGSPEENPAMLTCHDWHEPSRGVPWNQGHIQKRLASNGFWAVDVERAGRYEFVLRERPEYAKHALPDGTARLKIGAVDVTQPMAAGSTAVRFEVELPKGKTRLVTWLEEAKGASRGAFFVEAKYLGE